MNDTPRLFLVDSFALAFRIFYAFARNPLVNSQGQDNSLVHGYLGHLLRLLASQKPTHFAIVKDMGRTTFRHTLYPDYKANRGDMPEEMQEQLPRLEELLLATGLPVLGCVGYEADDILAYLARKAEAQGFETFLVTKDKDLGQVVSPQVRLFQLEKGNDFSVQGPAEILEKFGVPPEKMRDYLALVGDSSDNVPGVPKVGPKSAVELLTQFDSLDGIYENLEKVPRKAIAETLKANREKAFLSRELVTLQINHDFGFSLEELTYKGVARKQLKDLLLRHELRSLVRSVESLPDQFSQDAEAISMDFTGQESSGQPKPEYVTIQSVEALLALEKELANVSLLALDTETDSLESRKANLVGLCIAGDPMKGYYVPVGHHQGVNVPLNDVCDFLQRLFLRDHLQIVFHNAKYDLQVFANLSLPMPPKLLDSMLATWLLDPGQPAFGLDEQVRRRLGHAMIPIDSLIGKGKQQISFADVPIEQACPYGAEDAVYTLRLWNQLWMDLQLIPRVDELLGMEMSLVPCLMRLESHGIALDSQELSTIQKELESRLIELSAQIHQQAGQDFNIASPKQLGIILFETLLLPTVKKTSTGFSTDAATLEELRGLHPIVELIQEWREINKLQNTYVEVLPGLVDASTGRLHTSFVQTGTATGRLSSRDPNLQNIPIRTKEGKRIRAAFIASTPETVLLSADYSQIELRMLAHLSKDPNLCKAYREGIDIHALTAGNLFGVPHEMVTSDMRRQAKVVNFGVLYGMTAYRLARDLGIERSAAKSFIDGYFGQFPTVKDWIEKTVREARDSGYVETITGRRRLIPGITSSDATERQMAERMVVNSPVQGSAADLIKIAMLRIDQRIQKDHLPLRMLLQVHDELVFECPGTFVDQARVLVKEEMEGAFTLSVPLLAEVGVGRNWLEAH